MSDGKFSDTQVNFSYGPVGTIWQLRTDNDDKWKLILQFRVQSWRWNYNGHFEMGISSMNGRTFDAMTQTGVEYFVTVGGFF